MDAEFHLDVALIHHPVVNRHGEIIGSAVTNLDLHDIARASKTFGVSSYWVVTPYPLQQELAAGIVGHWTEGYGGVADSDRAAALALIKIRSSLAEVIDEMTRRHDGRRPKVVATSAASSGEKRVSFAALRQEIISERMPVLLLFGTAWGLAPEALDLADAMLPPIVGPGAYNHLSVRSAASIMLDRLLGRREEADQH
ncbi:RNA methyltransferase [Candidatus Electronema sp. JM]|uniref:RNA methyltransferase n=1 Tax=Candidatus Electronema sp. JM TaxID=3401571 RepID=UPI003AA9D8CC